MGHFNWPSIPNVPERVTRSSGVEKKRHQQIKANVAGAMNKHEQSDVSAFDVGFELNAPAGGGTSPTDDILEPSRGRSHIYREVARVNLFPEETAPSVLRRNAVNTPLGAQLRTSEAR
ncbi:unnamed protein product, partial [Iphiclides podalirius]